VPNKSNFFALSCIMTKLLVVCSEREYSRVAQTLHQATRSDRYNEVAIWQSVENGELLDQSGVRTNWKNVPAETQIIATKSVLGFPVNTLLEAGYSIKVVSREAFFGDKTEKLEKFLGSINLCWRDQAEEAYASYDHRAPDFDTTQWLKQFESIGAPALGEAILRQLRVMPTDECINLLTKSYESVGPSPTDLIATLSRFGKSGAALSGGLRRRLMQDPIVLNEAIESTRTAPLGTVIHVFEDGLWTGIELSRVIDSLLGIASKPKMPALSNPELIHNVKVVLHFSIATDIGVFAATSLLAEARLRNFSLALSSAQMINILTDQAREKFERGELTFKHVKDFSPEIEVVPNFLALIRSERNENSAKHMCEVIRALGSQLWSTNSATTEQEIPSNAEFGANGIGSTTLFRHSSPRAVLPMLWASGQFKWGKRSLTWKALVPENGPQDHQFDEQIGTYASSTAASTLAPERHADSIKTN
jgi:hypothetical protein